MLCLKLHADLKMIRSPEITININSPSVRFISAEGQNGMSLPVFGDYDHVMGTVSLDPQNTAAESGKLTITVSSPLFTIERELNVHICSSRACSSTYRR